jgi:hypothetical protein
VSVEGPAAGADEVYVVPASTRTDKDGRFVLTGLARTTLSVAVRAKGHRPRTVTGLPGGDAMAIELEARGPADERRRQEIARELTQLRMKLATSTDAEERRTLDARESLLRQELAVIGEDSDEPGELEVERPGSPSPVEPPVPDVVPPPGK